MRTKSRSRSAAGSSMSAASSSMTLPTRTLKRASPICARRCWSSIRRPTIRSGLRTPSHIFLAAKHPKSFISLAGADHLSTGTAMPPMSRA